MIYLGIYKYSNVLKFGMSKNAYKRQYQIRKEAVKGVKNPSSFELLKVFDVENKYNRIESLFIESYIRMSLYRLGFNCFGNDHFNGNRKVIATIEKIYYDATVLVNEI